MNSPAETPESKSSEPRRHIASSRLFLRCLALAALAGWILSATTETPREAAFMAVIFVLAATLWVTEALPLFATSLLVIGLQAVLLANPGGWPARLHTISIRVAEIKR